MPNLDMEFKVGVGFLYVRGGEGAKSSSCISRTEKYCRTNMVMY